MFAAGLSTFLLRRKMQIPADVHSGTHEPLRDYLCKLPTLNTAICSPGTESKVAKEV